MRRGRCARRAMLGAVAAGALLGAARGYEIDLIAGETGRADDEYKVVTTAGLEIVIGPSAGSVYDIAPAAPDSPALTFEIAVEGGNPAITPSLCVGGYTLDASSGDIACYGVQRVTEPLVTNTGGSLTVENGENNVVAQADFDTWWGASFANCPGDIDFDVINNKITCYAVDLSKPDGRGAAVVENTGGTVSVGNSGTVTVVDPDGGNFSSCP